HGCNVGKFTHTLDPQKLPVPDQVAIQTADLYLVERTGARIEGPQGPRQDPDLVEEEPPRVELTGARFRQPVLVEQGPDIRLIVDLLHDLWKQPDLNVGRWRQTVTLVDTLMEQQHPRSSQSLSINRKGPGEHRQQIVTELPGSTRSVEPESIL